MVAGGEEEEEQEEEERALAERKKRRTGWLLIATGGLHMVALSLPMAAEQEIWLRHFQGDFGANARQQGLLQAADGVVGLLCNPLIASATDAFGRRPLLILCQSASLLRCLALAASPTVRRVVAGTLLRGFCMSVLFVAAQAALGDLFKSQPQLYGRFVSLFMMTMPLSGVLTPLIGSTLASRSLRLPYVAASVLAALTALATLQLSETCQPADRVAFKWVRSSPLNFVRLFTSGPRLRMLALTDALGGMTNAQATIQTEMVQRTEQFGWDLMQRASFQSLIFGFYTAGFSLIAPIIARLGLARTMFFGTAASVIRNLVNGLATTRLGLQANIVVLGWTRAIPYVALKTANMQAGVAAGMPQGELQGCCEWLLSRIPLRSLRLVSS